VTGVQTCALPIWEILSPVLFSIFNDELILMLKSTGVGCYVVNTFMGAFAYADDIILLAPTRQSAELMLNTASQFSVKYDIKFNASKSKLLLFDKHNKDTAGIASVVFNNQILVSSDVEKHLGNFLGKDCGNKAIKHSIGDFYARFNAMYSKFKMCTHEIKYKLFKSFCMPLYGCVLWNFSNKVIETFYTAWRKCIRTLFGIPQRTHCNLLPYICNDQPVDLALDKRIVKFVSSLSQSSNDVVLLGFKLLLNGSDSTLCKNLLNLCHKYHVNFNDFSVISINDLYSKMVWVQDPELDVVGNNVRELLNLNVRFSEEEWISLIRDICEV
jgi:hypothetical protein